MVRHLYDFPSHFFSLKAIREKLKEKMKDVDAAQSKEVPLFWYGMAEVCLLIF